MTKYKQQAKVTKRKMKKSKLTPAQKTLPKFLQQLIAKKKKGKK
tara:strand:+ start:328 stop:459 length:132 start_codon:yes stop_codon:yes gene_type:complete